MAFETAHAVYFPSSAQEMADLGVAYLLGVGINYWINPFGDSITCVKCRNTSQNAKDVSNRYCGFCHVFHPPRKMSKCRSALSSVRSMAPSGGSIALG